MRVMKSAGPIAAAIACAAAPAANAADMCTTLKAAIAAGTADKAFTSLQSEPFVAGSDEGVLATRQIDGFVCKVSTEEGRGYFACIDDAAKTGKTEAAALSPRIGKCLGLTPVVTKADYSDTYVYTVRANPKLLVYMSGSMGKLLFLNVVAY